MGLLKKIGKALGGVVGAIFKPIGSLLSALLPKPKIPKSLEQSGTQYNAAARFNESRLGDPKAVVYGQCRVWPAYCSMPYKEFEGQDQRLNAYLHITVGEADVLEIKLGDTSANRFPGFEYEVLAPGEDMELVLPNVYTCPEVEQIELLGGAQEQDNFVDGAVSGTNGPWTDPDTPIKVVSVKFYEEGTTTIDATAQTFSSDTDGAFNDFQLNDEVQVYDAGANNGTYTITDITDDGLTIVVDPAPASSTTQTDIGFFVTRRWAGGYPACPPGETVDTIALDFIYNALQDKDKTNDKRTNKIVVQYREIDDLGNPTGLGTWTEEEVTHTDNVNRVRRYTNEIVLSGEMRPEVRVRRDTYEQRDQEDPSSALTWVGLKGYIVAKPGDTPASDDDSTRIAVVIRSSGMLSKSENALNCLVRRKIPVYESGGWTAAQFTRNPAWCAADWLLNQSNGAVVDANLDIDSFVTSASTADTNEDTFDAVFDRQVGLWEGAQTILRVARSKPILNPLTRLYEVYRDEPSDPVVMLCDGFNARLGSDSINLPDADTITGVEATFMEPLLWVEREGPVVGTEDDVRKVRGMGWTSWQKAFEEATFEIRDLLYRNHTVSAETEMDGLIPIHGNRVLVASAMKGWGHSGEVVEEVSSTTLSVWPAPVWTTGMDHYIYLQDEDGTPVGPINVVQGPSENFLILESDPGITIRTGEGWKTLFAFGHDGDSGNEPDAPRIAIVQQRSTSGPRTASLDLLFDHPYVHEDPGAAPEDPYATDSEIPDLTITGLEAEQIITGDVLLDPNGDPLVGPDGEFLIAPGGVEGGVVVTATWDAEPGATSYQLRWKYVGSPPWHYASTIGTSLTFAVPTNGTVRVRVKALSTTYVGPESSVDVVIDAYP